MSLDTHSLNGFSSDMRGKRFILVSNSSFLPKIGNDDPSLPTSHASARVIRRRTPTVRISAFAIAYVTALIIAHSDSITHIASATLRQRLNRRLLFLNTGSI